MKYRSLWALFGALMMAAGAVARAQEAPPSPPAAQGEALKLVYKYKPGAVYHYRCSTTGTMTIDLSKMGLPTGAGQAPSSMPMDLAMQFDLVQKVKSVDASGNASVVQSLDAIEMSYKMLGQTVLGKTQNGKLVFTMNGQPMAAAPPSLRGGDNIIGQTFEARLAPTGRVLDVKGQLNQSLKGLFGGNDLSQVFGAGLPGLGMLVLPVEALQVGQQWTDQMKIPMPLPLPANPGGATEAPKADCKIQYTLKDLQQKGPRRIALIESRMEMSIPHTEIAMPQAANAPGASQMSLDNFSQTVTGTHSFDVTDGALRLSDHASKLGMQMQMAMPGAPAGATPGSMGFDGSFNMKVALLPNPPAKAGPAKSAKSKAKPARKGKKAR